MSSINKKSNNTNVFVPNNNELLKRSCMNCMLWEKTFYEDGEEIYARIAKLADNASGEEIRTIMYEAKNEQQLRHLPLALLTILAKKRELKRTDVCDMITRADDLSELLALYWRNGKVPIPKQMKLGMQDAFVKFNEYQLGKYKGRKNVISLKDVIKLVRPTPSGKEQSDLWKKLVGGTLDTPKTWETMLSAGQDKKRTFTELLAEKQIGGLALIRNLRNMRDADVDGQLIRESLRNINTKYLNPYLLVKAGMNVDDYQRDLEFLLEKASENLPTLKGKTVILVDNSGSMQWDDRALADQACSLALVLNNTCEWTETYAFSNKETKVSFSKGFALIRAIKETAVGGTALGRTIRNLKLIEKDVERLIVITDEQSQDNPNFANFAKHSYIVNVAPYENGVGYSQNVTHFSGISPNFVKYIAKLEEK